VRVDEVLPLRMPFIIRYVSWAHIRLHSWQKILGEKVLPQVLLVAPGKRESSLRIAPRMLNVKPAEPGGGSTGMLNENSTSWFTILRCSLTSSFGLRSLAGMGQDVVVCPARGFPKAGHVLTFFLMSSWGGFIPLQYFLLSYFFLTDVNCLKFDKKVEYKKSGVLRVRAVNYHCSG